MFDCNFFGFDRQSCKLYAHKRPRSRAKNQELTFLGLSTGVRK